MNVDKTKVNQFSDDVMRLQVSIMDYATMKRDNTRSWLYSDSIHWIYEVITGWSSAFKIFTIYFTYWNVSLFNCLLHYEFYTYLVDINIFIVKYEM